MRLIDTMTPEQIEALKLKGMLREDNVARKWLEGYDRNPLNKPDWKPEEPSNAVKP